MQITYLDNFYEEYFIIGNKIGLVMDPVNKKLYYTKDIFEIKAIENPFCRPAVRYKDVKDALVDTMIEAINNNKSKAFARIFTKIRRSIRNVH